MLFRALFCVAGVVSVGGAAMSAPPGLQPRPHAEGRELDPVTREHFLPEAPAVVNEAPAAKASANTEGDVLWAVLLGAHAAVLSEFTMPLGTARVSDM